MKEEVTFLIPTDVQCPNCKEGIDITESKVIVVVICPHCGDNSAYREDNKIH